MGLGASGETLLQLPIGFVCRGIVDDDEVGVRGQGVDLLPEAFKVGMKSHRDDGELGGFRDGRVAHFGLGSHGYCHLCQPIRVLKSSRDSGQLYCCIRGDSKQSPDLFPEYFWLTSNDASVVFEFIDAVFKVLKYLLN